MEEIKKIIVDSELSDIRIDKFLAESIENMSRTYIQKLITDKKLSVNGKIVKSNYIVNEDDEILLEIPQSIVPDIIPEDIKLNILYEDKDIVIINKPKGMVVHPAPGHYTGTLVNALMFHCKNELSGINGVLRPGIVHRIDRDTTGAIVVCKNDYAHQMIAEQLKNHSSTRIYNAIVHGTFENNEGRIEAPIGRSINDRKKMSINYKNGKDAITNFKIIERFGNQFTHIECKLETGRTHQIRVHMASIGHPLLGDEVYGYQYNKLKTEGQTLHARTLGFVHPTLNKYVEFEAPMPEYFIRIMDYLRSIY